MAKVATNVNAPVTPPASARTLRDGDNELVVWPAAPGLIRTSLTGRITVTLVDQMIAEITRLVPSGPFQVFHDWSGYTAHDAAARSAATSWTLSMRSRLESLHILLPPPDKLLAMGIAASNLLLGGFMRMHHSRAAFEAEFARAAQR